MFTLFNKICFCFPKALILHDFYIKQSWKILLHQTIMENYMAKAADAFLIGRPYGIRLDFKHKGFALFNYNMNELGNHLPGRLEMLPLEEFDVEDIPLCGERIVRKENITDIFFYDEKSNPYSDNRVDMKKLKAYNKYIYPLSLILNKNL